MGYSMEVMQRARARLAAAKADRESENRQHLDEAYAKVPRLREIDRQLRLTMAMAAQAVCASGGEGNEALGEAENQNLALQRLRGFCYVRMSGGAVPSGAEEGTDLPECGPGEF